MEHAPSFTLRFGNIFILGLIDSARQEFGWSDSGISRDVFKNADAVKTFRLWDGARRSPTLRTALNLEDHVRTNLGEVHYQQQSIRLIADMTVPSILTLAAETGADPDQIIADFTEQLRRGIASSERFRPAA
ncbi:hypothetical protein [Mangrovibrevibacter kandeliae]|uniref:hypothetical protein n=1 Tax=Mangrovibrevibacter kandeliae TaxID=2968473 RepID=UPI002118D078|nr:hypothetical protein [Aurantimonas sp. CSK15Z-1]MCQ8781671.1 hypothetical protein [Aurantimonas sp. CSK15Z-1]